MSNPQLPDDYVDKWRERAETMELEALSQIRGTAEKWGATIGALTGVFTLVVLVKGPEDISSLIDPWRPLVYLSIGAALLQAFIAIYMAALAAQGTPIQYLIDPIAVRDESERQARIAASRLSWSRKLVIGATLTLALAIALTWLGPREDHPLSVIVVERSGAAICGQLARNGTGELLVKNRPVSKPSTVLKSVASLQVVQHCP